ncbi:MAG: hypothetical protein SF182_23100, partial [Deltaproteobacteria bacterium]|nr:hypothetical protein [Deltaproteobacteria bacterium]
AAHLHAALTHLRRLPASTERDRRELMLVQQLGAAMLAANGVSDPELAAVYRRGQSLAQRLQMPVGHFGATAGLFLFHVMRADLDVAEGLAETLGAAAANVPFPESLGLARAAMAAVQSIRGDLVSASRHLAGLRGIFPRRDTRPPVDSSWYLGLLATLYASLGQLDAVRAAEADLLGLAARGTPSDIAQGHLMVAGLEALLQDAAKALQHADVATAVAAEHRLTFLQAAAGQLRGWAVAALGDPASGLTVMGETAGALRPSGLRVGLPFLSMLRADALLRHGDWTSAAAAITAGLEQARTTGERRYDSDLHRLRAECLRRQGRKVAAGDALKAALGIAAAQGTRLAELRAAIDGHRLHRATPARAAAAERLAAVAASFDADGPRSELAVARALLTGAHVAPDWAQRQAS